MNIRTRTLVFCTFFGSCIAIGLLLISLTTNHWVHAYPRRENYTVSHGEVNYGLFYGTKELNIGVGIRTHSVTMYNFITSDPAPMNFWLWLITALGTGFGLLSCAIAAIVAVVKAASAAKNPGMMILLIVTNISSAAAQILAFTCWLIQFYQYLTHNVLNVEDHQSKWYSRGLAHLGYSFYLVVASTLVIIFNVIILLYARKVDRQYRQRLQPPSEEKNQRAIMLY